MPLGAFHVSIQRKQGYSDGGVGQELGTKGFMASCVIMAMNPLLILAARRRSPILQVAMKSLTEMGVEAIPLHFAQYE